MISLHFLLYAASTSTLVMALESQKSVYAVAISYLNSTAITACGVIPQEITAKLKTMNFVSLPETFRTTKNPNEDPLCLREIIVYSPDKDTSETAVVVDFHKDDAKRIDDNQPEAIVMISPSVSENLKIADADGNWISRRQISVLLSADTPKPSPPKIMPISDTAAVVDLYSNGTATSACGYVPDAIVAAGFENPHIVLSADYRTTVNAEYDTLSYSKVSVTTPSGKECWCYVVDFTSAKTAPGDKPRIQLNQTALQQLEIVNSEGHWIGSRMVSFTNQNMNHDDYTNAREPQKTFQKTKQSIIYSNPSSNEGEKLEKAQESVNPTLETPLPISIPQSPQPREDERMRRRMAEEREFEAARNRDAIFVAQFEESLPTEFAVSVDKSFPLKGTHLILSTPNGRISAAFKVTNRHNHSQLMPVPIVMNRECFRLLGISEYYTLVKLCVEWWSAPPDSSLPSVGSFAQIAGASSSSSDDYSEYMEYMENCDSRPSSHQSEDALYTKQRHNKKI